MAYSADYTGFICIAVLVFFLHALLQMVNYTIEKHKKEKKVTWDWVFVFDVKDEDFEGDNDVQRCVHAERARAAAMARVSRA